MRRWVSRGCRPDRGLVEDVEGAPQPRAHGGGEGDALGLAPRQRAEGTVEAEVVEPDLGQEAQPPLDSSVTTFAATAAVPPSRTRPSRKARASRTEKGADLLDAAAAHPHAQRLGPQAAPPAGVTLLVAAVPAQEDADLYLVLLGLEPPEEAEDTLELLVALEHRPTVGFVQVRPRAIDGDAAPSARSASARPAGPCSGACSRARWLPWPGFGTCRGRRGRCRPRSGSRSRGTPGRHRRGC